MRYILLIILLAGCASAATQKQRAGNQAYDRERYETALQYYQDAQVLAPDKPDAYYNAASALAELDDLQGAQLVIQQAIETANDPLAAKAYYNLGDVYYRMRLYQEAVEAYQQSLLINPDDEDARHNLEVALLHAIQPSPTAQEQQTDPDLDNTDPETTPTDQPGGFDGPTPTPPPLDFDLTATPDTGEGIDGSEDSLTPVPQSQGEMTVEQAERLLDQIREDQESLREYLRDEADTGDTSEKDW